MPLTPERPDRVFDASLVETRIIGNLKIHLSGLPVSSSPDVYRCSSISVKADGK